MNSVIYFDNNATTSATKNVAEAMYQELLSSPSNASSTHSFGQAAKAKLTKARQGIANFLKVKASEVIFTSGGTESMNLLIQGFCQGLKPGHIISSNIEHSCVMKPLEKLSSMGWRVTFLPAEQKGYISALQVREAIEDSTFLIVLGSANSETGIKNEIQEIANIAFTSKIPFIVDAVASFGKEPFIIHPGVAAAGFSAHKFHGPKGIGFCFARTPYKIRSLFFGGEQEFGLRPGTENLPAILGLAAAIDMLSQQGLACDLHVKQLRDYFEKKLIEDVGLVEINGDENRVCNVSNVYFKGLDGETLLIQLDQHGILASHGSACSSGSIEPSKVLIAMGFARQRAKGSIRFSFSRLNTFEEVDQCIEIIKALCLQLRSL